MHESEVTQLCPTLHDPMDYSLPASSIHEIFQARVLEWGAIAFSIQDYYCILNIVRTFYFWWVFLFLVVGVVDGVCSVGLS